ncbi:MAG: diversity-generating retroelement protein Avd [Gammaproteobacteria bacterium]|nr:diversity-generating retroelement protein Avd [Gammaproteobacteria bacterium]
MSSPQAVQDCHDLLVWLIPQLDKFPRTRRFTLGSRLENGVLAVLEDLVEAAYAKEKKELLRHANRQLEVERHLWRAAHELKLISSRRYEHGIRLMNTIGRQIGGWLRGR